MEGQWNDSGSGRILRCGPTSLVVGRPGRRGVPLFWIVANFRDFGAAGTVGWAIGLFFGSVFLAWLVGAARGSVLVVALWHTAYNFATATEASEGSVAAVATVVVVLATVWIMRAGGGAPPASAPRG